MSHFSVLVIGPDHEAQLAPYDENMECEPRREAVELEEVKNLLEHYHTHPPGAKTKLGQEIRKRYGRDQFVNFPIVICDGVVTEPDYSLVRLLAHDWFGKELFKDEQGFYNYTRYNPQSHWDWYVIGGRWTGYFKIKPGCAGVLGKPGLMTEPGEDGWADQCLKAAVDIDEMRDLAGQEAAANWDRLHAIVDPILAKAKPHETWEQVRDRTKDINKARERYGAQPVVKALQAAGEMDLFTSPDRLVLATRAAWIQQARDGALTPFAVVKDGQWYERGRMGWWGTVSNEKDPAEWNAEFAKLFDALPDDTALTVLDCHI